ncbi:hypothetical protein AAFH68_18620 [Flavobacterium sp. CGRL1]
MNEIKNLEDIKKLTTEFLNTLKPAKDEKDCYTAEVKVLDYYELGCVVTNMLKLCILALEHEEYKISETRKDQSINVALMLEVVLQLFPLDEFEFLSEIKQLV